MRLVLIIGTVLWLGGCSHSCKKPIPGTITITAESEANQFSAVAIDIVTARDPSLVNQLSALKSQEYFALRSQLLKDFPATMVVTGWEITPGQVLEKGTLTYACDAEATYIFASYNTKGEHRVKLAKKERLSIVLRTYDFEVDQ